MKLTVEMVDTFQTEMCVVHMNDSIPFGRRLVTIELTPEQIALLRPKKVGTYGGQDRFEDRGHIWLEPYPAGSQEGEGDDD